MSYKLNFWIYSFRDFRPLIYSYLTLRSCTWTVSIHKRVDTPTMSQYIKNTISLDIQHSTIHTQQHTYHDPYRPDTEYLFSSTCSCSLDTSWRPLGAAHTWRGNRGCVQHGKADSLPLSDPLHTMWVVQRYPIDTPHLSSVRYWPRRLHANTGENHTPCPLWFQARPIVRLGFRHEVHSRFPPIVGNAVLNTTTTLDREQHILTSPSPYCNGWGNPMQPLRYTDRVYTTTLLEGHTTS